MAAEAGLSDRVVGLAEDILDKPMSGQFDIATARALFQLLSEEQCQQGVHSIAGALPSGGTLFIIGLITDDSRISPKASVGMNILFLNIFDSG